MPAIIGICFRFYMHMPVIIGICFRFYMHMRVEKKKHLHIEFIVTSHNSVIDKLRTDTMREPRF